MKIKVCGIREPAAVSVLQDLGIDFVGHIFYSRSPRFVGAADGNGLTDVLPGRIRRVGVFVDEELDIIQAQVHRYKLDLIQLHGKESPAFCTKARAMRPIIKAIGIRAKDDLLHAMQYAEVVDHFLFDTKTPTHGGSGKKFEWDLLEIYTGNVPFFLSGGIGPGDVEEIRQLRHPQLFGVDLNSGFETSPGVKDLVQIKSFVNALQI